MNDAFGYFDEAYFEQGSQRGTAYSDYLKNASTNPTFLEIARAIAHVFRPRRCLEIGCATGAIVRHLNDLGVDAHGIDVSEWAVAHREHRNVLLAPAHELPFPNAHFDLVYSAHAIEHIPVDLKDRSFVEIDRVSSAWQFHMLPIIGDKPYVGDADFHVRSLQKDPTHVLLNDRGWWQDQWSRLGWSEFGGNILFLNDNAQFELSSAQILLQKSPEDSVVARMFAWNREVAGSLFQRRQADEALGPSLAGASKLVFGPTAGWKDLNFNVLGLNLEDASISGTVDLLSDSEVGLRFAILCRSARESYIVTDEWYNFKPGRNEVSLLISAMNSRNGQPNLEDAVEIKFGGSADSAQFSCELALAWQGKTVSLSV